MLSIAKVKCCVMVWDEKMAIKMNQAIGSQLEREVRVKIICNPPSKNNNSVEG